MIYFTLSLFSKSIINLKVNTFCGTIKLVAVRGDLIRSSYGRDGLSKGILCSFEEKLHFLGLKHAYVCVFVYVHAQIYACFCFCYSVLLKWKPQIFNFLLIPNSLFPSFSLNENDKNKQ